MKPKPRQFQDSLWTFYRKNGINLSTFYELVGLKCEKNILTVYVKRAIQRKPLLVLVKNNDSAAFYTTYVIAKGIFEKIAPYQPKSQPTELVKNGRIFVIFPGLCK